jgi:hypothetical protein
MITEIEQQSLDIDWFFITGQDIAFVASGGGKLPQSVAQSLEGNKLLSSFFRSLPVISEVIINPDLSMIITTPINEQYLVDFMEMTKRGLFSFDKTILNNFSESHYHLVAKPANPLKTDQLPFEIKEALFRSQYHGSIDTGIDASFIL